MDKINEVFFASKKDTAFTLTVSIPSRNTTCVEVPGIMMCRRFEGTQSYTLFFLLNIGNYEIIATEKTTFTIEQAKEHARELALYTSKGYELVWVGTSSAPSITTGAAFNYLDFVVHICDDINGIARRCEMKSLNFLSRPLILINPNLE